MPKKRKSKLRRRLPLAGIFLLLMIGITVFMYPIVGMWYTEYTSKVIINEYNQTIQQMGDDAIKTLEKQATDYNDALAKNKSSDISAVDYNKLLRVAQALGYIEIPRIDVYYPIFHGMSDEVLQRGIGHLEGTSLPVGGKSTHCVLAGHTGLPSSKLFTDIDQLKTGDSFYIHVLDKVLKYEVDQIKTVLPHQNNDIAIVEGRDYVTLVTCTPYGINSHRLLVRGKRVPYETKIMETEKEWPIINNDIVTIPARTIIWYSSTGLIGFVILGMIIILIFPSFKRRKKTKEPKEDNSTGSDDNNTEP